MRRKEPWFKLWATDYLTDPDVDELSLEAQGLLLRMWCVCSQRGNIPEDPEEIARLTQCRLQCVLQCHLQCKPFFKLQDGLLYSARMEREKAKSEKARATAEKRWKKKTYAPGYANGNANGNAIGNTKSHAQKAREPESQKAESQTTETQNRDREGAASETSPKTDTGIDPHMMARGLCERLNLSRSIGHNTVYEAVYDLALVEEKRGDDLEALCDRMVEAYQAWMGEKSLEYRWGAAKFFGEGWWEKPETWPRKNGGAPPQTGRQLSPEEAAARAAKEAEEDRHAYWKWESMGEDYKRENPMGRPEGYHDGWQPGSGG